MRDLLRKALTRKIARKGGRGKQQVIMVPPSDRLLYVVYLSLGMVACLSLLEAVHLIVLSGWNSEVFAVIAGLVGNVTGIFMSQKA